MKKHLLKMTAIAAIAILASCKSETKNETAATEAEAVENTTAEAGVTYNADAENSIVNWKGFKPTGTHTGTVGITSGNFEMNGEEIVGGAFTLDMNTITVTDLEAGKGKEKLEAHLKGTAEEKEDHFFNVQEFPTATFEVTGVSKEGEQTTMQGNLTIKGTTKNIAFPVMVENNGDTIVVSSEPFTIDRTQWNVNFKSKSIIENLGDNFINDEIELSIKVAANKG